MYFYEVGIILLAVWVLHKQTKDSSYGCSVSYEQNKRNICAGFQSWARDLFFSFATTQQSNRPLVTRKV